MNKQLQLCEGGLIKGPETLHAIVNPDPNHAKIFFDEETFQDHCKHSCPKTMKCTHAIQTDISKTFKEKTPDSEK